MKPGIPKSLLLSLSALSILLSPINQVCLSEESTVLRGSISMDELAHKAIKKELELAMFNSEFREHYMKPNKWRDRRHNFYDMAAGGVANAGDITLMSQFWHYYRNPGAGLKHKGSLESGAITVMVAYLTLGGLYAAEGLNDLLQDYRAKRQGWDSHSVLKKAESLKAEIDSCLASRKAALDDPSLGTGERQLMQSENKVLEDCRDLTLLEFSKLYVDARKKRIARDVTTIGTIAVCATGAFPGAMSVVRGIEHVNLKEIGGGGIGFLVSGATLAGAPLLIHGGAAIGGAWTQKSLSKALGDQQCKIAKSLQADVESLNRIQSDYSAGHPDIQRRMQAYGKMTNLLAERQAILEEERRLNRSRTVQDFLAYAIEGGPQIAWGTMVARAGYRWNRNPARAFKLIAEGATVNEVAWGSWLLNSSRKTFRDELYNLKHRFDDPANAFNSKNQNLQDLKNLSVSLSSATVQ
jgi:hypothetical protein